MDLQRLSTTTSVSKLDDLVGAQSRVRRVLAVVIPRLARLSVRRPSGHRNLFPQPPFPAAGRQISLVRQRSLFAVFLCPWTYLLLFFRQIAVDYCPHSLTFSRPVFGRFVWQPGTDAWHQRGFGEHPGDVGRVSDSPQASCRDDHHGLDCCPFRSVPCTCSTVRPSIATSPTAIRACGVMPNRCGSIIKTGTPRRRHHPTGGIKSHRTTSSATNCRNSRMPARRRLLANRP